jgi:glutamate 5-kinase
MHLIWCRVIHTFMPSVLDGLSFCGASSVGRGGMEGKVASAWDAAQNGVTTVIANGKLPSVLLRVRCSLSPSQGNFDNTWVCTS